MATGDQGQVAWITGGGTGIGLGAALELARAGWRIAISGRRADVLESAGRELGRVGATPLLLPLDVADASAVSAAARTLLEREGRIDLLVNNAGWNVPKRFLDQLDIADWQRMIDVNLSGALYCAKAVLPAMRARRGGLIVNVASWGGKYVVRAAGAAYTAAKHAIVALSESMNIEECVHGIRVCALCPAEVSTPFLDQRPVPPTDAERRGFLQPDDMGRVVRFLAELPPHVCINEMVISPVRNPLYLAQHPPSAKKG